MLFRSKRKEEAHLLASRKEASFFVETEKKKKNAWEKQEDIVTNVEKTHTKNAPNPLKINKNID